MKIYVDPLTTSCRLVLALIEDQNIPIEICQVSLAAGENRSAEFLSIQPSGKVPVLCDGDFVLTESLAIARYLLNGQESPLYPADPKERARIDELLDWISTALAPAFLMNMVYPTLLPHLRFADPGVDDAVSARGRQMTRDALAVFDRRLAQSGPYAMGSSLTLADFAASAVLCWAPMVALSFEDYPHVAAWRARMRTVPAWWSQEQVLETYLAAAA